MFRRCFPPLCDLGCFFLSLLLLEDSAHVLRPYDQDPGWLGFLEEESPQQSSSSSGGTPSSQVRRTVLQMLQASGSVQG